MYGKLDFYLNNFLWYCSERNEKKRRSRKAEGEGGEGSGGKEFANGVAEVFFFHHHHYLTQGFIFMSFILISLFYTRLHSLLVSFHPSAILIK